MFIQDAMRAKEEFSDLIKKQQNIIDDLKEQIELLNKNAEVIRNLPSSHEETQAGTCTRDASTSTHLEGTSSGVPDRYVKVATESQVIESHGVNNSEVKLTCINN
ncbi:hypothetical protein JTB14_001919 [Gonioctena quinquepunctata]|nr:hypothetical protein JTB14_001919 [Gonioctena quinquepunctata]